jgi:SAM-dependent methyltransferase/uncharacterized protein YbaR (Trm112 family)
MHTHLADLLSCRSCRSALRLASADDPAGPQVTTGSLTCDTCGTVVPIRGGVPRFDSPGYVGNFSKQWKRFTDFAKYYSIDDETYYKRGLGLVPSDVAGKRVLEVGCGNGRAVGHFLQGQPQLFVAVDLSEAVDVVQERFGGCSNLLPIESDLRDMPLPQRSFDIVFSYGVLHHTPDIAAAFEAVAKFVAPGGLLAVWVYNPKTRPGKISDWVQRNCYRIPRPALLAFCWFCACLGWGFHGWSKTPVLRAYHARALKATQHYFRVLDSPHLMQHLLWAHDFHTTRYTWYQTPQEVRRWFEQAGFEDMVNLRGSGMIGRKSPVPETELAAMGRSALAV